MNYKSKVNRIIKDVIVPPPGDRGQGIGGGKV
jgi:hypothetical protein